MQADHIQFDHSGDEPRAAAPPECRAEGQGAQERRTVQDNVERARDFHEKQSAQRESQVDLRVPPRVPQVQFGRGEGRAGPGFERIG